MRRSHPSGGTHRASLAGLLLALLPSASLIAQSAQSSGRLEGTVTDSLRAVPFAGATVRVTRIGTEPEVTLSAVADRRGRYRFDRLDEGSYAVSVTSPMLDSLEYGGPPLRVSVSGRRTTHA